MRKYHVYAIGNALVLARPGVYVATVAQDYTFGRTFVEKYKKACEAKGAKVVIEEFLPIKTADFTASAQRIIKAMKDIKGRIVLCNMTDFIHKVFSAKRLLLRSKNNGNVAFESAATLNDALALLATDDPPEA